MKITRISAINYTFLTVNMKAGGSCGSDVFLVKKISIDSIVREAGMSEHLEYCSIFLVSCCQ